ncbi:MAG: hypothetical protein IJM59_03745 [Proteobacteria bacterium]|nr:hypothetical protein [Pseudomonadota bacterium]
MNRTLIIVFLCIAIVIVLGLGTWLGFLIIARTSNTQTMVMANVAAKTEISIPDKFAGREKDAIEIVQNYNVWKPEYIDALIEHKTSGKEVDVAAGKVTIQSLVESQFLENRFNMHFLQRGEWRAIHLDTDTGDIQIPDPQYEVYLDYKDESAVVGPVWIVDLETKAVVPRNDMASIFDRDLYNYAQIDDNLKRPERVVHAITSHKFDVGIDLGGILLLHFLNRMSQPEHIDDEIIGWTVMNEFQDDFIAYFQWRELGEVKVAKFKFNWENKSLQPKGLYAFDLMAEGETHSPVKAVDIFPNDYTNNLGIPRTERWTRAHKCRSRDYRDLCTAFVKVLEQQEFINAMSWMLTNGEPDASRRVSRCKEDKKCGWIPKTAGKDLNPQDKPELIEVSYKYELNERSHTVRFLVDSSKETITPLDKISKWAYFSVTPRT